MCCENKQVILFYCCLAPADRVGSVTLKPAVISLSSHPQASSPRADSPMITGWHLQDTSITTIEPAVLYVRLIKPLFYFFSAEMFVCGIL